MLAGLAVEGARWSAQAGQHSAPVAGADMPPGVGLRLTQQSSALIDMPADTPSAHASALAVLPRGEMLAFWFAGSRESGPDVQVFASRWSAGEWGPARPVAGRESLGRALGFGVRRIGNPAAWTAPDGKVHLFVVATGLGGWASSRVAHLVSADAGDSFEVRRILPMSPLFNTSVLVRTTPLGLADGGWWLPVHFEMGTKYPMVMSFDPQGQPRRLTRIGERTEVLQPALVAVSATEVRAWMRDIGQQRKVQQAVSRDAGASWQDLPAMDLPNDNSSVAGLRLRDGGYILLYNRLAEGGSSRNILSLAISADARSWSHAFDLAKGERDDEYSYPSLQQVGDALHVTYTHRRVAIAHHVYRIGYGAARP